MARKRKAETSQKSIEQYEHKDNAEIDEEKLKRSEGQ